MNLVHREALIEEFYDHDYREGHLINDRFHEIGGPRVDGINYNPALARSAITRAISEIDSELSDEASDTTTANGDLYVSGTEPLGFDAAKRAGRWLRFRASYIDDLKDLYQANPGGVPFDVRNPTDVEDPWHSTYESQLNWLELEHAKLEMAINMGDPVFIGYFAALEKRRRDCQDTELNLTEPFEAEHYSGYKALIDTLDDALKVPPAVNLDNRERLLYVTVDIPSEKGGSQLCITCYKARHETTYTLRVTPLESMAEHDPDKILLGAKEYTLVESNDSEQSFIRDEPPTGTAFPPPLDIIDTVSIVVRLDNDYLKKFENVASIT
jgi:hypothetical protein